MIGATFCSGIGAPEVAAPWVDWRLASEVVPFPRAVLMQRFGYRDTKTHRPGEPLLWGDMRTLTPDTWREHGLPLPDIVVAGTPCQSFSVAGLRGGLHDDRGNLTMKFVELCHAIAKAKPDGTLVALWENVPGILSDRGNAFGAFLGRMCGAVDALPPPADGRWPGEGMVQGPRARAAWAVLDARWFGVAQRRRRLFAVIGLGDAIDPAKILLEPDRLRGNSAPRRKEEESLAATLVAIPDGSRSNREINGRLIASTGQVAHCLNAGGMGRIDYESKTMVVHAPIAFDCKAGGKTGLAIGEVSTSLRGEGHGGGHVAIANASTVRRLMPVECHRLQGFPDDHCAISFRGKPAADGPQYKALGNSMAVPVVRWIMERIHASAGESEE